MSGSDDVLAKLKDTLEHIETEIESTKQLLATQQAERAKLLTAVAILKGSHRGSQSPWLQEQIRDILRERRSPMRLDELVSKCGKDSSRELFSVVNATIKKGWVRRIGRGMYEAV